MLLYVYVLHSGYSEKGLLLASQLQTQTQLAHFKLRLGQIWPEPDPCKKNCPQGLCGQL